MLAFIEGSMERQFINANFKYVRVIPVYNGITWTVERICQQIETAYSAINYHGDTFVWIDREGRNATAADIKLEIKASLINAGADPQRLYVLVNDRMSENIILADEEVIREEFGRPDFSYTHEGRNGKRFLSEMYKEAGVSYKEMVQGVNMLKRIRVTNSALRSDCVSDFLNDYNGACWWI